MAQEDPALGAGRAAKEEIGTERRVISNPLRALFTQTFWPDLEPTSMTMVDKTENFPQRIREWWSFEEVEPLLPLNLPIKFLFTQPSDH